MLAQLPKQIRFVALNAENLFVLFDKPQLTAPHSLSEPAWQNLSSSSTPNKPLRQVRDLAKCIRNLDPDVVFLSEVGGLESLQNFNRLFLDESYHCLLIEGNSPRGIDVAYLAKMSLPFTYDLRTHKDRPLDFQYPHEKTSLETGYAEAPPKLNSVHRFSRDVLELRAILPDRDSPYFVALAVHLKSALDREKIDPQGRDRRRAELEKLIDIYLEIEAEFAGQVPILIGGDFNGVAAKNETDGEFGALYARTTLLDALELAQIAPEQRFTHMQIQAGSSGRNRQIDYIFLNQVWQNQLVAEQSYVFRFLDEFGMPMPVPHNLNEKALLPTDHYPVVATIQLAAAPTVAEATSDNRLR